MRPGTKRAPRSAIAVVGVLTLVLAGCPGDEPKGSDPARSPAVASETGDLPTPDAPDLPADASPAEIPSKEPLAVAPAPIPSSRPAGDTGVHAYVAKPRRRLVDIYREPGAAHPRYAFDVENPFGQRVPLLVERGHRDEAGRSWIRVQLPIRPNGTSGWVLLEQVKLLPRDRLLVVDLSQRRLRHYVAGRLVDAFRVGIGRPGAPSARGMFSVWAKVRPSEPGGPYGTYILGLSGLAPISEWTGEGRMAIHGTVDPSDRGRRVSSGCVRVFDPQMERLTGVPLGTPVVIHA